MKTQAIHVQCATMLRYQDPILCAMIQIVFTSPGKRTMVMSFAYVVCNRQRKRVIDLCEADSRESIMAPIRRILISSRDKARAALV